jgi:hypothetical protein
MQSIMTFNERLRFHLCALLSTLANERNGGGYDANGNFGYLNDLWEFNPSLNAWAWIGGSSTADCMDSARWMAASEVVSAYDPTPYDLTLAAYRWSRFCLCSLARRL